MSVCAWAWRARAAQRRAYAGHLGRRTSNIVCLLFLVEFATFWGKSLHAEEPMAAS